MLRVSEVYASVQGEGPRTGRTTVFVRFGGCNLRCPGWPCDTAHAIFPEYREEWRLQTPDDLLERIRTEARLSGAHQITLTGGEPFLQPKEDLRQIVEGLTNDGYLVEAFTNGTLLYPSWAVDEVHMIMDWKLPGSGEDPYNGNRQVNLRSLDEALIKHAVKFVCKDYKDLLTAINFYRVNGDYHDSFDWYYGKVWDGDITDAELVERVMYHQLPWKLNVQLHNYIWDPQERGR